MLQTKTNTSGGSGTKKGKFAFRKSANTGESDGRSGTRTLPTTKTASPVGPNEGIPLGSTPVLSRADNNVVFKDRTSAYISRSDLDLERRDGVDLTLTGLERCVVDFVSKAGNEDKSDEGVVMTAVRAENVKSCVLLLGRVRGSVILHGLEGCLVVVECHQVSVSFEFEFYVWVKRILLYSYAYTHPKIRDLCSVWALTLLLNTVRD